VAELVDARDLKSLGQIGCTSSILVPGTKQKQGFMEQSVDPFFMNQTTGHDLPEQGDHGISHQCIHLIISQTTYNLLTGS
jgi:hypothetical protein